MWPFRRRASVVDSGCVILFSGNATTAILVKSLLDSMQIKSSMRNEWLQDLFGCGRLGGFNHIVGPVKILINREDAEIAYELVGDIRDSKLQLSAKIAILCFFLVPQLLALIVFLFSR